MNAGDNDSILGIRGGLDVANEFQERDFVAFLPVGIHY